MLLSRRDFLLIAASGMLTAAKGTSPVIMTIDGAINADQLGPALIHEHFLVDFIGANKISNDRWNRQEVLKKVLPYLQEVKLHNIKTIFDCTPAYLGRDVVLLKMLADKSGLQVVTNTGYYGALDNKHLPAHAFIESAEQLASRWIKEFENGIEGTGVKPGFIKIGVNPGPLSPLHQKLVTAAAITNRATGLTICSHTGGAVPAFEQIEILQRNGVKPDAFVWVHAQEEKDKGKHMKAAENGTYISLDGIGWGGIDSYADSIQKLKQANLLHKVLISHDAGWYKPAEQDGGKFTPYTNIFTQLIPALEKEGFTDNDFKRLLVINPAEAFAISE